MLPDVSKWTLPESTVTEHLQCLLYSTGRARAQQQDTRTQRRTWQPGGPGKKRLIISPTFRSKVQWKDNLWKLLLKARDALWWEESVNPSGRSCLLWMHVFKGCHVFCQAWLSICWNLLAETWSSCKITQPIIQTQAGNVLLLWNWDTLGKWGRSGSGNSLQKEQKPNWTLTGLSGTGQFILGC